MSDGEMSDGEMEVESKTSDEMWRERRNAWDNAQQYEFNDGVTRPPYSHRETLQLIQLRQQGMLNSTQLKRVGEITQSSRITGFSVKTKKDEGLSFDEAGSGHHEWIPTDLFSEVMQAPGRHWSLLFWYMRCPTWLLIINPERYHQNRQEFRQLMLQAQGYAKAKKNLWINASQLQLTGHSNGLSLPRLGKGRKQLTTFQSNWHDELRGIWRKYKDGTDYLGWCKELRTFISNTFLFVDGIRLPDCDDPMVSVEDTLRYIRWDLSLTVHGPITPAEGLNLLEVAQQMRDQWAYWLGVLENNIKLVAQS